MYFVSSSQVRWPGEIFEAHPIPVPSREFLTTIGLPEAFSSPMYEFGVYDSQGPDLVIGEDFEHPIFIDCVSGAVLEEGEAPQVRWFINSSVECLSCFLYLAAEFQRGSEQPSKMQAFTQMREEMLRIDPDALAEAGCCTWALWLAELASELASFDNAHEAEGTDEAQKRDAFRKGRP
ncbi:SUKH-4 family immunity protein [Verrucomicrobiota bacterium sgz303538]